MTMRKLVFLTRDGCGGTPSMRNHLDEALRQLGVPADYEVANVATLASDDPRRGYPTPTVLYGGTDLFDMEVPTPPFPEPS
ncbi:MAG: hypothetical protein ACYCVL_12530 [Gemmatimonadaceae bacterium]